MSDPKEPKYFLCGDAPPPAQHGPGDAHSRKEWIWRRDDYEALFDERARRRAARREHAVLPVGHRRARAHRRRRARRPADRRGPRSGRPGVLELDPLWSDGYEPIGDFVEATELEAERVADGWAPFWRYLDLGRYGEQLEHLYRHFPREQVHVIRYRELVDEPDADAGRGSPPSSTSIPTGFGAVRGENVSSWVPDTPVNQALRRSCGPAPGPGSSRRPQVWRTVERPLRAALRRGAARTGPTLTVEQRAAVQRHFVDDVELLERPDRPRLPATGWVRWAGARTRSGGREPRRAATPRSRGAARRAPASTST